MSDQSAVQNAFERGGWKSGVIRWLIDQGVVTVLLFLLIGGVGYGFKYLVPAHLEAIQEGYQESESRFAESIKEINTKNIEHAKESETRFEKIVDRVSEKFDKDQDRDREMYLKLEKTTRDLEKTKETLERAVESKK